MRPANAGDQREYVAFPDWPRNMRRISTRLAGRVCHKRELNQPDGIPEAEGEKIMTEKWYKALKPC